MDGGLTYQPADDGGTSGAQGFPFIIEGATAPANDEVCSAVPLTLGVPASADGTLATAQPGEVNPGIGTASAGTCESQDGWCNFSGEPTVENSLWYTFMAPPEGRVNISTDNTDDAQLAIWSVTDCNDFSSFTEIAANDDSGPDFSPAIIEACVTPGEVYYVQIDGFDGFEYNTNLTVTAGTPSPTNDLVCDAIGLTLGVPASADGRFCGVTAQPGEVSPGAGTGGLSCESQDGWCSFETNVQNSLWYTFVAPAEGRVTIGTDNTDDTQLALWSVTNCNDFGTFTEIAANDDSGPGLAAAIIEACVTPGELYYVQIDGFDGFPYNTNLTVSAGTSVPPALTCPGPMTVECGDDTSPAATGTATPADVCGFSAITYSDAFTPACGGSGTITRTWIATFNGATATCPQTITVKDTQGPTAICQPATYTLPASGSAMVVPADLFDAGASSDVCGSTPLTAVSASPNPLTCADIGDNTVTLTVEDDCGNPSTCETTVTILVGPYFTWYKDTDDDGYSDGAVIEGCTAPFNYKLAMDLTATSGDCNDSNPFIHPGRFEECNGFDDDCDGTVDENPVTAISIDIFPGCDDMGTSDPSDDVFTAYVSVEFDDVPPNGILSISGDATASVPVGSLGGGSSHTFTDVPMSADGGPISISASFSATGCVFMAPNLGAAPESCSNCSIVGITVANAGNCDAMANTDPSDDTFTADVTVDFLSPPASGTLDLMGDGSASVPVGSLSGSSYTFTGVEMTADGGPISLTASFSDMACPLTVANAGMAPEPCCFVDFIEVITTDEECSGGGTLEFVAEGTGPLRYSVDGGATWQLSGIFTNLSSGDYDVVAQVIGQGCSASITVGISTGGTSTVWYKDIDGDGYTDGATLTQCTQPTGYVASALPGDCNDYDADEHPGQMWYADLDGDGYTDGPPITSCSRPTGYVLSALPGDCDDSDPAIYSGAPEICDGLDNDCDGMVDEGGGSGLTYMGNVLFDTQEDVDAFSQCYSIIEGSMTIQGSVYDLSNLINIVEVTGNVHIKSSDLMSMGGLDNLATIGGYLKVRSNGMLTTLDGLQGVTSVGGYLRVYYNGDLTDCCAIHDLLNSPGAIGDGVNILRNDTGCDDEDEIDDACDGGGEGLLAPPSNGGVDVFASQNTDHQGLMVYPNPTSGGFNLRFAAAYGTATVQVFDLRGALVLSQEEVSGAPSVHFEKGGLASGVYLVKAIVDGEVFTQKLMVKE